MRWPVIITAPHASGQLPESILFEMLKSGESSPALVRRIFSEGDPYTERIYEVPGVKALVVAEYSRFVVDLNRDRLEPGIDGVIKLSDFQLQTFYAPGFKLSPTEHESRLIQYWDPYHQTIEKYLQQEALRFLIDGHSMVETGPSLSPDSGKERPALCLGNLGDTQGNPLHTPLSCSRIVLQAAADAALPLLQAHFPDWAPRRWIGFNDPFDGGYILKHYTSPNYRFSIPGMMVEFNRGLYLDEAQQQPFPDSVPALRQIVEAIMMASLGALAEAEKNS